MPSPIKEVGSIEGVAHEIETVAISSDISSAVAHEIETVAILSDISSANNDHTPPTETMNEAVDLTGDEDEHVKPNGDPTEPHFQFNTNSPILISAAMNKQSSSELEDEKDHSETSAAIHSAAIHDLHYCGSNCGSDDNDTYHNDEYDWTETYPAINEVLPPSFSSCFLYVNKKTEPKVLLVPGVTIIDDPRRRKREPEIYLCAAKCGKENSLNFLYAKIQNVEDFINGTISFRLRF